MPIALAVQVGTLVLFVIASEVNLQDDKTEIQFTWKCPRDSHSCSDTSDLTDAGCFIFSIVILAHLAKDLIVSRSKYCSFSRFTQTLTILFAPEWIQVVIPLIEN